MKTTLQITATIALTIFMTGCITYDMHIKSDPPSTLDIFYNKDNIGSTDKNGETTLRHTEMGSIIGLFSVVPDTVYAKNRSGFTGSICLNRVLYGPTDLGRFNVKSIQRDVPYYNWLLVFLPKHIKYDITFDCSSIQRQKETLATPISPPPISTEDSIEMRLKRLNELKEKGLITKQEYETKSQSLLMEL